MSSADQGVDTTGSASLEDESTDIAAGMADGGLPIDANNSETLRWPDHGEMLPGAETWTEPALRFFFTTGIRPASQAEKTTTEKSRDGSFHSAVLHPYRSSSHFRNPWPLVLGSGPSGLVTRSLPEVIDLAIDSLESEGDTFEVQKRALYRLEKALGDEARGDNAVGEVSEGQSPADLSHVLDEVSSVLLDSVNGKKDRYDNFRIAIARFQKVVAGDDVILPFGAASVAALQQYAIATATAKKASSFREEIDWLNGRLSDLLRIETEDSSEGVTPERLEHTVGGAFLQEFDFGSLSHLLEEAPHGASIPPDRRARIDSIQATLEESISVLYGSEDADPVFDVTAALEMAEAKRQSFTQLVRSVHMARLEAENRYRPERHDLIFEQFSDTSIEAALLELRPPISVQVDSSDPEVHSAAFQRLLGQSWPVRCLISLDRLLEDDCRWSDSTRLGMSLISLGDVYVGQVGLAAPELMAVQLVEAAEQTGSSVVIFHAGSTDTTTDISAFLGAGMATDSRALPVFSFNPRPDADWAECFEARGNEQPDSIWPCTDFIFPTAPESEPQCTPVTPADYLSCDHRFADHFLPVSRETECGDLMPLAAFLEATTREREQWIPYVLQADERGYLIRAVVSKQITGAALAARSRWRILQEWSGFRSSVATRQVEETKKQLSTQYEEELGAARLDFEQQLNSAAESVARRVVENIASGLLGKAQLAMAPADLLGSVASGKAVSGPAGSTSAGIEARIGDEPAETEDADANVSETTVAAEDDDDTSISFDEAYIDTPLCTTCNECTDLNGLMFAYNENKQALIKDRSAGTFRELVMAAEKCPARIIHPGKPMDPKEPNLEEWVERARPFL